MCLVVGDEELYSFCAFLLGEDDLSDTGLRYISAGPVEPENIANKV